MSDRFAERVFKGAGVYGIVTLFPMYFMEHRIGVDVPPPVTHPEHFYGFIGVALAWQVLFFIIASDPVRFRPAMLAAIVEKLAFGIACLVLYGQGRIPGIVLAPGVVDLVLAVLFAASYRATRESYAA